MKIVIVGAGPAGVSAAETLRTHDRVSEVVMLSAEPYPPYSPPAMVDHFLTGSDAHLWRDPGWAEQTGVDYRKGVEVTAIQPDTHSLHRRTCPPTARAELPIASARSRQRNDTFSEMVLASLSASGQSLPEKYFNVFWRNGSS